MLYTDSDVISADSLAGIDSEITAVAAASKPGILIEGAGSICEQAWQECGRQMLQALQSYVSYPAQTGMPATHMAAVTNVGVPARTQARIRLNQIVATESNYAAMDSQIQHWMQYYALYLFYRDASSRMGKDRYQEKMERFQDAAVKEWRGVRSEGLPFVYRPLEAPGAKHAFGAGVWGAASLSGVAGGTNANPQSVSVAITWYDALQYVSQSDKGNAESGGSEILPFSLPANQLLHIDISSLNPPNGQSDPVGLAQGSLVPLNATHWNIWAGASPNALYLQKEGLPVATKSYSLTADPVSSGSQLGRGQYPDLNQVFMNIAMRG